jgi:predicted TIM-barrel fold metal-dependent hydrolase
MKNTHIHIGQFEDAHYEPLEVIDIVMASGMEGLSFSSTTSRKDDVQYREVEKEIIPIFAETAYSPEIIRPFLWFIPDYIRQGVSVESACSVIPYKGIKIHPLANSWNLEDLKHREALRQLFEYAAQNALPVLIHTGESGVDSPDRFERFFGVYPGV